MEAPTEAAAEPAAPSGSGVFALSPALAPPLIQVAAGENTPLSGPAPRLRLRGPRDGQLIKADKVEVTLDVANWALTPDGNHIHLIVDNEPYLAVRDTTKPFDLGEFVQKELGKPLTEGTHVLRSFPGRPQHESVKLAGAFEVKTFHFKHKTPDFAFDPKAPLLTYSRPKGCVDAGSRVLLDFFVTNTKLGPTESRVRYVIDGGSSGDIVQWTPHYIENLPVGEHQLELSLRDRNGEPIPGPFNASTRTIRVATDCKALASAAAANSGTPAATAPANAPLVTTPTPAGPATPAAAPPSETGLPKPAP